MKSPGIAALLGSVLIVAGCSDTQEDPSQGGQGQDAGACVAVGTWTITTQPDAGAAASEPVEVSEGDGGGAVSVEFVARETPQDRCMPPTDAGPAMGTSSQGGTFDPATCLLTLEWQESYCQSGEQQCEAISYELKIVGDVATGTMHRAGGWCMDKHESDVAVTATRVK